MPDTLLADKEDRTCEVDIAVRGVAAARGVEGTAFSGSTGIRDAPKRCVLSDKRLCEACACEYVVHVYTHMADGPGVKGATYSGRSGARDAPKSCVL